MSQRIRPRRRIAGETPPGQCMLCGRRLVRTPRGGNVHEENEQIRCPIGQDTCVVCDGEGLIQCSTKGCETLSHPACSVFCECCGKAKCRVHARPDGLCWSCSGRPAGQHGHESVETFEESPW